MEIPRVNEKVFYFPQGHMEQVKLLLVSDRALKLLWFFFMMILLIGFFFFLVFDNI